MNKKISLGAAIAFMAVVAAVTFCFTWMFSQSKFNSLVHNVNERAAMYNKLEDIDSVVRSEYVGEIDNDKIIDAIAKGYVNGLDDKYSAYLDEDSLAQRNQSTAGVLVGIGISASADESGYIKVKQVYDNSPAQADGIKQGDLIIAVDDQDVKTLGYDEAVKAMKGEAGTKVKVTIYADGAERTTELTRKNIEVPSVEYQMLDKNGYIRITDFNDNTTEQLSKALNNLAQQGAEGLIFDVRNNGGGTLASVKEILDTLLPAGVIATSTDKAGNTKVIARSDANEINLPMVTIANKNTASAAELFVAALRDYDKAKMVGGTTYGKGVMQQLFTLQDGTAVNLTTAYFNPPKSKNFNGVGLSPDFEVSLTPEQEAQFLESVLSLSDDPQVKKAQEVLNAAK